MLLYMSPHYYVSSYYYMCPHATIYLSSYYYISDLILRYMCHRKLAGRLELVLLDQSDPSDDVVGTGQLMLAPLLSRRGITGTLLLCDAGGQVSA